MTYKYEEVIIIETLLEIHNGDFELWKEENYNLTFYHLAIEGYIGFKTIGEFIDLYSMFLEELKRYLIENKYPKPEKSSDWGTIYKARGIEVCFAHDYYWVFLDEYTSTEIWDTYYYLEDVIKQLKKIENGT